MSALLRRSGVLASHSMSYDRELLYSYVESTSCNCTISRVPTITVDTVLAMRHAPNENAMAISPSQAVSNLSAVMAVAKPIKPHRHWCALSHTTTSALSHTTTSLKFLGQIGRHELPGETPSERQSQPCGSWDEMTQYFIANETRVQ